VFLKSITLKGFKSFPERTRLEFGPGVSVIVGPNGSGKSNITDAVLWALGEQSPVAVRGQSMQDVIFGGAPGRQAGRAAEVELVLDDSDGVLNLGAPEVSIQRRLDRTGESEYRLSGARCRLVDVIEVLSDTGLGKEMHSVISQGRVESIVTSKPRDRRLLIEEAAGLGKHRKRRRRAQLKLIRTQDNLDRALDVEREARSRLRPLKRQAEAADLHARLERQTLEARWELAREDLRAQLLALTEARTAAEQARARGQQRQRELEQVGKRREAAEEALARRSAEREELSRHRYIAQSSGDRIGYRIEAVRRTAGALGERLDRNRSQLETLDARSAADVPDEGAVTRIAKLEGELAALERHREAELARQLAELEQQLVAAGEAVDARSAETETALGARRQAEELVAQARSRIREAEREVEAARREAARVGGELAAVNQFLRGHTNAPGGARALADELEVDSGLELALAAALDGRLRAALVGDRRAGSELLDRAGGEGGRALVARSSDAEIPADSSVAPTPGATRIADRVRGRPAAVALVRALLHDTWVVQSLDDVPESFGGVAVTPDGRVWSAPNREIRQAPALGEERVLAERNRREQLIAVSETAAQAEVAAHAGLQRAASESARIESESERAVEAHRLAVRNRDEAAEERRRITAMIEHRRAAPDDGPAAGRRLQLTAELSNERAGLQRAQRERDQREAHRRRLIEAIGTGEELRPAVARVIEALESACAAVAEQRAGFEAALAADREAGEHVTAELKACAQQEATLHAQLHRENEARTEIEVRLQRAGDRAAELERELGGLAARLQLAAEPAVEALPAEEREALHTRLERLARRREQLGPVNPLAQQEYADAVEHVEELERQRADLEDAMRELEKLIADTDKQIRETFEKTFEAAAGNFEQVAARLFPGGRGRLRLVAEREGPARVLGGVATPSEEEEPRPDEAESELEAHDPGREEDLLGVEIEITPLGKEMKRLSLLSGGEKSMTALAFLFAVFLARPCPFYILDEVEAALDDLNIDRFLQLLRAYSGHAQFIVVTHQKRTMEAADSLYGVSMSDDGISKVISRRLTAEEVAA
jgi:chromosome segregation protein